MRFNVFFQFFEDVKADAEINYFCKLFIHHKGRIICTHILQDVLLPYINVFFLKQDVEWPVQLSVRGGNLVGLFWIFLYLVGHRPEWAAFSFLSRHFGTSQANKPTLVPLPLPCNS